MGSISTPLFLGIDVGTGSVRAGLFNATGEKLGYGERAIKTRNEKPNFYEQCSADIWHATEHTVRTACASLHDSSAPEGAFIAALGIDATCSLVACCDDETFAPLSVVDDTEGQEASADGGGGGGGGNGATDDEDVYNVMLWLDQRAAVETADINSMDDPAVRRVRAHFGGKLSPENEPPKLLWLRRHKPDVISRGAFFDLADWLALQFCADAAHTRSSCTVACKWGWGCDDEGSGGDGAGGGGGGGWSGAFWEALGLGALASDGFRKIGRRIAAPGARLGRVREGVADRLGLPRECVVAVPMIDAHAGSLWAAGARVDDDAVAGRGGGEGADAMTRRLSVVCGTSTCFIQMSRRPLFVEGVWGPFRDAVVRGLHVSEGGQSVTGKLLEATVTQHAAYDAVRARVSGSGVGSGGGGGLGAVFELLSDMTEAAMAQGRKAAARRTEEGTEAGEVGDPAGETHVLDYHAGNRSPVGDATLTGAATGLTVRGGAWELAVVFRATVQALACGARHVVEALRGGGHDVGVLMVCGGLSRSRVFVRELADCVGAPVVLSGEADTVLLGGAILARAAWQGAGEGEGEDAVVRAARAMSRCGEVVVPNGQRAEYFRRKYAVYRRMQRDTFAYRDIMREGAEKNEQ